MAEPIVITPPTPLPDAPPVPQRNDPETFEERNDAGYEFVFEQLPPALERLEGNVFQNAKATEQLALAADASSTAAAESERKAGDSETAVLEAKGQTERARDDAVEAKEDVEAIANKFGDVDGAVTVATEQAGISTAKASEATLKAASADSSATRAEQAKDAAGALTSFYKSFLTEAAMRADLATTAGRTSIVIEGGPTWYYKIGGSGTGSWEPFPTQPASSAALEAIGKAGQYDTNEYAWAWIGRLGRIAFGIKKTGKIVAGHFSDLAGALDAIIARSDKIEDRGGADWSPLSGYVYAWVGRARRLALGITKRGNTAVGGSLILKGAILTEEASTLDLLDRGFYDGRSPRRRIVCWGDSLPQGANADPWPQMVHAMLGREVEN